MVPYIENPLSLKISQINLQFIGQLGTTYHFVSQVINFFSDLVTLETNFCIILTQILLSLRESIEIKVHFSEDFFQDRGFKIPFCEL